MNLVDNEDAPPDTKPANEAMFNGQHGDEHLIDCANPDLTEEYPLAAFRQPSTTLRPTFLFAMSRSSRLFQVGKCVFEKRPAVSQQNIWPVPEEKGGEPFEPVEHGIGGGLCRQGEDNGIGQSCCHKPPGIGQRRLGFPTASRRLNEGQTRFQRNVVDKRLHGTGNILRIQQGSNPGIWPGMANNAGEFENPGCIPFATRLEVCLQILRLMTECKILRVTARRQPIGNRAETREQWGTRRRRVVQGKIRWMQKKMLKFPKPFQPRLPVHIRQTPVTGGR